MEGVTYEQIAPGIASMRPPEFTGGNPLAVDYEGAILIRLQ